MGGFANNAPIVTDGLVFYVDAGNSNSYPGSGTTWSDLIGGNDGTLEPALGPTYNSANGGSIVFDGTDDLVDFGNILNLGTQDMTISAWVKLTSNPSGYVTIAGKSYAGSGDRYFMGTDVNKKVALFIAKSGGSSTIPLGTTVLSLNTWYLITGVWDRSGNASIYINDTADTISANADISAYSSDDITDITIPFRIGSYAAPNKTGPLLLWPGNIAATMLYFRTLSPAEITQNYNALKNRFV